METELALQLRLGQAFAAALGYGAAEAGEAFSRASVLCAQIENSYTRASVLGGLWVYHSVRANHKTSYELARQLWKISIDKAEEFVIDACYARGVALYWMGEFSESARILQKGATEYKQGQRLLNIATADSLTWVLQYFAACLWHLGYPARALQVRARALERAASIKDPFTIASARLKTSMLRLLRRDTGVEQDTLNAIAISAEDGFTSTRLWNEAFYHCARLQTGLSQEISTLREVTQKLDKLGARLCLPWLCSVVAYSYGRLNNPEAGLDIIDSSLSDIERSSERQAESELHRLKGELLLLQNPTNSEVAEKCFSRAIDVARRQHAKSWELRATMSLARLLVKHGQLDQARTMLGSIYNWFTEGFDTADLKDAKALLEELST